MSISSESLTQTEQQNSITFDETSQLQEVVHKTRRVLGRCVLALSLASGSAAAINVSEAIVAPTSAEAATFANEYPDMDATDCSATYGTYSWCKDGGPLPYRSNRLYDYRNCTDGVAWWVTHNLPGYSVPSNWGNAETWDNKAPSSEVDAGNTNSIEPGDIAQDEQPAGFGHVGFVTDVIKDANGTVTSITVAELNKDAMGNFSHDTYTSKNTAGNFIRNSSGADWDHYIDVNGTGKGLNNEVIETTTTTTSPAAIPGDFNNDKKTDPTVYRPSNGTWYIKGIGAVAWGLPGDIPAPEDYNGDGKLDPTVYRPSNQTWYTNSPGVYSAVTHWGLPGDVPVPGDYDGDSKHIAERATYRPSNSTWHINGAAGEVQWGLPGDIPVPGDYDGDGDKDIAVFRPSNGTWYVKNIGATQWGANGDIPVPGNYDGEGGTDLGVFRPGNNTWYAHRPGKFTAVTPWGANGDIPVPGNYGGSKYTDYSVFRPSNQNWITLGSNFYESTQWGLPGDIPANQTLNAESLKRLGLVATY